MYWWSICARRVFSFHFNNLPRPFHSGNLQPLWAIWTSLNFSPRQRQLFKCQRNNFQLSVLKPSQLSDIAFKIPGPSNSHIQSNASRRPHLSILIWATHSMCVRAEEYLCTIPKALLLLWRVYENKLGSVCSLCGAVRLSARHNSFLSAGG
jgi:hypothetical protein